MTKAEAMREKPILCCAAMVRAILEDRKTQTRRVIKPQPAPGFLARGVVDVVPQWPQQNGVRWFMADGMSELIPCPYGAPGDRLWVREGFWTAEEKPTEAEYVIYHLEHSEGGRETARFRDGGMEHGWQIGTYRRFPSIHMPRWASRITLEITDVRVERIQDISHRDALAEGVEYDVSKADGAPVPRFQKLWDSLNAKRGFGWDKSPWVWAITFKRV